MASQTLAGKRNCRAISAPRWQRVWISSSTIVPPFCRMLSTARKRSAKPALRPVCEKTKPRTFGRLSLTVLKSRLKLRSSDR